MKRRLNNDEFESYLRQQVKSHRIYPADKVWRNIQYNIHGEKKWPALSIISIFIIAALTAGTLLTKPNNKLLPSEYHPVTQSTVPLTDKENKAPEELLRQQISTDNITKQTISEASQTLKIGVTSSDYRTMPDQQAISTINATDDVAYSQGVNELKSFSKTNPVTETNDLFLEGTQVKNDAVADFKPTSEPQAFTPYSYFNFMSALPEPSEKQMLSSSFTIQPVISKNNLSLPKSSKIFNNWLAIFSSSKASNSTKKASKFNYQVYITPSVSYRRLMDISTGQPAQSFVSSIPASSGYSLDINQLVHHLPALGMEVGGALGYKVSNQITIKTGLQFNIRQYNIQAYSYKTEPAAVGLISTSGPDTLNTVSSYRTTEGSYPITLNDRHYEISLPIGVDWTVMSFKKLSVGIAGSVQPTYTFDKQPFVITSDFKNYVNGSSLMRNWNINTSVETFIAYSIGGYTFQVGPQFRYQQLPTFNSQYPVREHLLDYGLKIGVSKAIK